MKEGRKTKDQIITEGFNVDKKGGLTKKELAIAKKQAKDEEKKRKKARDLLRKEQNESKRLEKEAVKIGLASLAKLAVEEQEGNEVPPGSPVDKDDDKSAYQMLQDMRWVYRKVKGRKKLADLIENDDKQFVFMVKELMKIEAQLMSARIRSKEGIEGSSQQTVFVVLKGLDEEKKYDVVDADVDIKQIQHVLQPEAGEYEPEIEEEKLEVTL